MKYRIKFMGKHLSVITWKKKKNWKCLEQEINGEYKKIHAIRLRKSEFLLSPLDDGTEGQNFAVYFLRLSPYMRFRKRKK